MVVCWAAEEDTREGIGEVERRGEERTVKELEKKGR